MDADMIWAEQHEWGPGKFLTMVPLGDPGRRLSPFGALHRLWKAL
jgi:hypothetical protein